MGADGGLKVISNIALPIFHLVMDHRQSNLESLIEPVDILEGPNRFELFPPIRGPKVEAAVGTLDRLLELINAFVSVRNKDCFVLRVA